ncbi:hypothetical protein [Archangium lansingense]|uniref:Uncharacterized protein n=1 Tax=Archangium lansingense TaxID=2995310 RepID=A0ABT4A5Q7_9BACT|nr:hypothetical protein [Archangium lansinium]MCY1076970.1 hypothetical protein [Archangium lansinium]
MLGCKRNADTPTLWIWSCLLLVLGACTPPPPPGPRLQQVSIQGTAREGETLLATLGGWSPPAGVSIGHQWSRCNGQGQGCSAIAGATQERYVVTAEDAEATLKVSVQVTGQGAPYTVDSAPTSAVLMLAPVSTAAPTISGDAEVGGELTGTPGTWRSARPASYAYQWLRCNETGAACAPVEGATSATYTLVEADLGATLRLRVTASNAGGSVSAESQPTALVQSLPPTNTAPPSFSGLATVGETLTGSPGTWDGSLPISYAYQWLRCDATGPGCEAIQGATDSTYVVAVADGDRTLRLRVTASNTAGTSTADSSASAIVPHSPPINTTRPVISGAALVGQPLTGNRGIWDSVLTVSYAYQWLRCDETGSSCEAIAGATGTTYTVAEADRGRTLLLRVTASNTAGANTADSNATSLVPHSPPSNTALPTISGLATVGETLTGSPGTWNSTLPVSYTYQWLRCNDTGSGCATISGATNSTYVVAVADGAKTLRLRVKASNTAGTTTAESSASALVPHSPPINTARPTISGVVAVGQQLSSSRGTWSSALTISYAYQWLRCDATGSNCTVIAGATSSTYLVAEADRSSTLVLRVTASNTAGANTAESNATPLVPPPPPTNTALPELNGLAVVGETLTGSPGTWDSAVPPSYTYQWLRCNETGSSCAPISGATASTYVLVDADLDTTLRVRVTASNPGGQRSAESARSSVIAPCAALGQQGPFFPASARGVPSTRPWSNPSAAHANDGVYATSDALAPSDITDSLILRNWGFSIPTHAQILGIRARVKRSSTSGAGVVDYLVRLSQGIYFLSNLAKPNVWGTTDEVVTYGGPTELWKGNYFDEPWTAWDVNDPNFGIQIVARHSGSAGFDTARVDSVELTVFYRDSTTVVGPNSPSVVVDDASIGTIAWTNPQNAAAKDDVYAQSGGMVNNQLTHYLKATGFNFTSLPDRTPSGIVVEIRKKEFYSNPYKDEVVKLVQGGAIVGENRPVSIYNAEPKYSVHGRPTDLWGLTPTAADLASPDFGVALASRYASVSGNGRAQIDHLRMWLLYDPVDTEVSKLAGAITNEQFSRDWDLVDNARLEDGAKAAVYGMVYNEVTSTLETSGYGFTVPANVRVVGVQLQVLRTALSGNTVQDYRVRLRGPAQSLSANRARTETWGRNLERIAYGRLSDRWGMNWTPADINDPAFGVSFETHYPSSGGNDYSYIDSTALTVFYCPQ